MHPALAELRPKLLAEYETARAKVEAQERHLRARVETVRAIAAETQERIMQHDYRAGMGG